MLVYISHSASDSKLCKLLWDQCENKGFTIISSSGPYELSEVLSEKGKKRIEISDVIIWLLTANGKSSYRVFQESDFLSRVARNSIAVDVTKKEVSVYRKFFAHSLSPERERHYNASVKALELIVQGFAAHLKRETTHLIQYKDFIY